MKKLFVSVTALLLAVETAAYAQGGGGGGGAGGGAAGGMAVRPVARQGGTGGTSSGSPGNGAGSAGAQTESSGQSSPTTAANRPGNNSSNSPLPVQPGNPQTGPIISEAKTPHRTGDESLSKWRYIALPAPMEPSGGVAVF